MPNPLCIYHKNCLDGSASAAVVKRKEPDCEFLAMQYGQKPPQVLDRVVYIVDFGLPLERMRALKAQAREVVWIDHHASHLPVRAALGWGTLDTSECGASLTWKCLFPDTPPPPVLAYIKDKDLWTWSLPGSRAIAAGLLTRFKGEQFDGLLEVDLAEMERIGIPELATLAARVAKAVTGGVAVENAYGLPGVRALVVNCNQDQNDVGDHICMPLSAGGLGYDLAILYYRKGGGRWVHSLRSGPTVDCAAIAEARGGGGHRNSACYLADDPILGSPPAAAAKNDPARR
ncbi:MAG: hypothetical protein H0W83_06990 [Planctomycetes bacterium]|nr:hypothetical protein [Planctomycetota bacterium]